MWAVQLCSLLSDSGILSLNDAHCIMRYEGLFGSQGCGRIVSLLFLEKNKNTKGRKVLDTKFEIYYWIIIWKS